MITKRPKGWRKGQTLFNFLEWLRTEKDVHTNQNQRLADTFHLNDADFDQYWEEFLDQHNAL